MGLVAISAEREQSIDRTGCCRLSVAHRSSQGAAIAGLGRFLNTFAQRPW